jgi:chemotaxis methyl-accepting protein methylase
VLPALATQSLGHGRSTLEVWSAGCASGEEPYTLAIIWKQELAARFPELTLRVLATDVHPAMLARARRACFSSGSLVFTYFEQALQRTIGELLASSLQPGGALVLGALEQLPADLGGFAPWGARHGIYRCPAVAPES